MDDEVDRLVIGVRADTGAVRRELVALRGEMEGPLAAGAERAGRSIESALLRAVRTGKLGFDDLRSVAMAALSDIAGSALRDGLGAIGLNLGSGSGSGALGKLLGGLLGLPGRATGGPVAPGAAYRVGERGPELFVPTASGRVEPVGGGGGARDVRVAITVNAPAGTAPETLRQSSRQVVRAVKAALEG